MIKSQCDNLCTSIFPSQYPRLLIKFLLILETEQLIPLFYLDREAKMSAFISNHNQQIIPVLDILQQSIGHSEPVLFFGSNFELSLGQKINNNNIEIERYDSFLVFTLQGLIIEKNYYIENKQSMVDNYQFISWDFWKNISIIFDENEPLCSVILWGKEDYYLQIETAINFETEAEMIEQQLPLIFCYLILKRFWKFINKFSQKNFLIFNPKDFLILDSEKLDYFINNILSLINITEKDLETLIRSIDY